MVYGVLAELAHNEIDLLYSQGWLNNYKPISIVAKRKDGKEMAASCYVAPLCQNASPGPNFVSLGRNREIIPLPPWYIQRLRKAGLGVE